MCTLWVGTCCPYRLSNAEHPVIYFVRNPTVSFRGFTSDAAEIASLGRQTQSTLWGGTSRTLFDDSGKSVDGTKLQESLKLSTQTFWQLIDQANNCCIAAGNPLLSLRIPI